MTVTRKAFREELATLTTLGVALTATDNGADTTHYQDSSDRTVGGDTTILCEGAPFVITSAHAVPGSAVGQTSRIASTAITSAGIITLARALDSLPKATQTAEVWHPALYSTERINDILDRALKRRCSFWHYAPLSLLSDGDMEDATTPAADDGKWGGTTAKPASNATLTKVALGFPHRWGLRYLNIANSGANGYAHQFVDCTEDDKYQLHVVVEPYTGEAEITVHDVTANAAITLTGQSSDDDSTPAEGGWSMHRFSFTTPSGCKQFDVRLGAVGASDIARYAGAMLWAEEDYFLPLPDRTRNRNRVTGFFRQRQGGSNEESVRNVRYARILGVSLVPVSGGLGAQFGSALGSVGPFFMRERRNYIAFAGTTFALKDADTTDCPEDYLYAAGTYELLRHFWRGETRRGALPKPEGGINPWKEMLDQAWADYFYLHAQYATDKETIEPQSQRIRR